MSNSAELVKNIPKEGTCKLGKEYKRFICEDEYFSNEGNRKMNICLISITALDGYKEFSIEELRKYDLLNKKRGNLTNNVATNYYTNNSNLVLSFFI